MSSRKIEFLYQSLADTQAIIRATDVKLGFLFAVVLLPVTKLNDIFATTKAISEHSPLYLVGIAVIAALWLLSFLTLFLGLAAISNPSSSVSGENGEGSFHGSNLFRFKIIDRFINRAVLSKLTVNELLQKIPNEEEEIALELAFEKIKTTYIRDIKIKRTSQCMKLVFSWVVLSVIIWGLHLFQEISPC